MCMVVRIVCALVYFYLINVLYKMRQKKFACQQCCLCQLLFVYDTGIKEQSNRSVRQSPV